MLPASAAVSDAQARSRAIDIGRALGDSDAVVLVITANRHLGAGNGNAAADRGVDARSALSEERADLSGFDKESLTAFVLAFAERVADLPAEVCPSRSGWLSSARRNRRAAGCWAGSTPTCSTR